PACLSALSLRGALPILGTGFLQGKASESSPPHQSASQTASPQGEAAGRGRSTALIPFVRNDSPSPPSWGAGRSLRRMQGRRPGRSEEHTSELQSRFDLV